MRKNEKHEFDEQLRRRSFTRSYFRILFSLFLPEISLQSKNYKRFNLFLRTSRRLQRKSFLDIQNSFLDNEENEKHEFD